MCLAVSSVLTLPQTAAIAQTSADQPAAQAPAPAAIVLDGDAPASADLDQVVVVPGATATDIDGSPLEVVVSVTDPTGVVTLLADEGASGLAFTPRVAGDFVVAYAVTDAAGALVQETRTVVAGGGAPAVAAQAPVEAAPAAAGEPDVRLGAIGDIHNSWAELGEAYDFWAQQGVDATMFVGDLTNNATTGEFDGLKNAIDSKADLGIPAIASMGNHDVAGIGSYDLFGQATGGQKPNADYTINGYHVISVSPGAGDIDPETGMPSVANQGDYAYARAWLQQRLAINTAADPEKPVMVLVHHPLRCTHYVSEEWYGSGLSSGCGDTFESVFDDFPQAVVWGGHIHTPQNIPTSIWQPSDVRTGEKAGKGFTTVNAPPLAYYEFESGVIGTSPTSRANDTTPDDAGDNRQTAIVEITGSEVTVKNYDLLADEWIDQTWTWDVADAVDTTKSYDERFPYNDELRSAGASAPVWGADAAVTVDEITGVKAMVSFPQAQVAPNSVGDIVHKYRYSTVEVATGEEVNTFQQWSGFYNLPMPADRRHEVWNLLPEREYRVSITPINAWGEEGEALTATFTTGEAAEGELPFDPSTLTFDDLRAPIPTADLLDVSFAGGTAVDSSPQAWEISAGSDAEIVIDEQLGTEVAVGVEGEATAFRTGMWSDADYEQLADGFTLDATFRLDSIDSGYVDVFGGMQSGGVGLEAVGLSDSTYELQFWYASPRPTVTLKYGQWYHVTATYDSRGARMYVDGVLKTDVEDVSFAVKPSYENARYMAIGGDANTSGTLNDATMNGSIAGVEMYSDPLNDVESYRVAMRELTAIDTTAPMVRPVTEPAADAVVGIAYQVPAVEAVDDSGRVEATVAVTDADGEPVELTDAAARAVAAGGTFAPAKAGEYTITYTAMDAAGSTATHAHTVTAAMPVEPGAPVDPGAPGQPGDTGSGGGAGAGDGALATTGGVAATGAAALAGLMLAAGLLLTRARRARALEIEDAA